MHAKVVKRFQTFGEGWLDWLKQSGNQRRRPNKTVTEKMVEKLTHHSPSRGRRADLERSTKGSGDSAPVVSARANGHTNRLIKSKTQSVACFHHFAPYHP